MRWESGRLVRWDGGRVVRKDGRMVRQKGGGYLVLFKGGEHKMSPRLNLLVCDVNQGNEGLSWVTIFLRGRRDGKTLLRSFASC